MYAVVGIVWTRAIYRTSQRTDFVKLFTNLYLRIDARKISFEIFFKSTLILVQNLYFFLNVVLLMFEKPGCGSHLRALSQNRGTRCKPRTILRVFSYINTMNIGSEVEARQRYKRKAMFLAAFSYERCPASTA